MMPDILVGSFLPSWLRSRGFVFIAFAAMSLSIALQSLMAFDHNDFLYAASAVRSGELYRDIHFVQGPVGFYFWHFVADLAPDGHIYLTLRTVSFALLLLTVGLIVAFILERSTARSVFLLLVASSFFITKVASEIGTYSLALCLVVLGLVLLLREKRGTLSLAIAGVLFGLAAGAKLNHILLAIPAFLWLVYVESKQSRIRAIKSGALFAIGTLIGLLPILSYMGTPWQMFAFHTLTFHTELSNNMRGLGILKVLNNLQNGFFRFFRSTLILLIPAALLIVLDPTKRSRGALYLGMTIAAIIMSALPIIFAAYLAPAALFINLAFCHAVVPVDGQIRGVILWMALPLFLLYAVHNVVSDGVAPLVSGASRLPAVERIATELRRHAASFDASRPSCTQEMFTFAGAVAVDSGFSLTPYTEAGMFWKHLNGFIPRRYKTDPAYAYDPNLVEPSRWVKAQGIDFLVTGFYPKYDAGLVDYADAEGFATAPLGELLGQDIVLRYRPECLRSQ